MNVVVYRSKHRPDTYLYLPHGAEVDDLPELLLKNFPMPESFLEFELHADRFLQRAEPAQVIAAIAEQGFYLQLPPPKHDNVLAD